MATWWRTVRSRVRWFELAPEAVLLLGLGLFAVTEPHAAFSAFKSPKAITLMAAVAIGWVAVRTLTLAVVRPRSLRAIPFVIGALAILKVVVLPAYQDHTVVETLRTAAAPATSVPSTPGSTPATTPTTTAADATEDPAPTTPSTTGAPAATTPPASSPETTSAPVATTPVAVRSGQLSGIDHRASGTVRIYQASDGTLTVGLEEFDIQPGPAYVLYVVPGESRRDLDGGVRLEGLRGNRGTQYYDVPAGADVLGGTWTVLVWCETFDVPVAHATPT
jgi:hypothetical protein